MARIFENGIGSSRKATRRFLGTTALTAAGLAFLAPSANAQDYAWSNFDTQSGSITITVDPSAPNTTNITQYSQVYIGNSSNLDILSHQTVNIGQNNNSAHFVARSTREGDDPTRILGTLKTRLLDANGRLTDSVGGDVTVIDRNGVFFGHDSVVDVGSIIVSTGNVSNADILDGDGQYSFDNFGSGKIEANGSISVSDGGLVGFVSPLAANNGVINAKMGTVVMAGGEKVTLDLYGDNLVEVAVDGKAANALLENAGAINAQGGNVVMTVQAAREITDNVINVAGVINASSASVQGGKIVLGGGDAGKVSVSGTLDASGTTGGTINVTGQSIETTVNAAMHVDASEGDAGSIELMAERHGNFKGDLTARAESATGKGGFVDTSAKEYINVTDVKVDTRAADGSAGLWVIDPTDITIAETGSGVFAPAANSTVGLDQIGTALASTNLEIRTNAGAGGLGNITFNGTGSALSLVNAGAPLNRDLKFTANNSIVFTDSFTMENFGNLLLNAGNDITLNNNVTVTGGGFDATAGDNIILAAGKTLNVSGGDITLTANNSNIGDNSTIEIFGHVKTNGGNLTLNSKNYFVELNTGGSIVTNGGDLAVNVTGTNGGFDIDENALLDLGAGDAHINARRVQLGDDIKTTGKITGTAQVIKVENDKAEIQDAIDVARASGGADITVAPGNYVETATNRQFPWSGGVYNMGLFVNKNDITIRGVDALGNTITDADNVLATVQAGAHTNFGAIHGILGDNVTISGLGFTPEAGYRNKTIEVWGNNFTLRNSVVDNSATLADSYGATGFGAGGVYFGDDRYDAATGTSHIQKFTLEGNKFIEASVTVTNGVGMQGGVSGNAADRKIVNNSFIGNGTGVTRANVTYNAGILLTGREPTVAWRQNPIGAVTITGNDFAGTDVHVLARGEQADMDWKHVFLNNTFDNSAAAFEAGDDRMVRGENYTTSGDNRSDWRAIYSTIQWAVNGAQAGDTVLVGDGTYTENVVLNKALSLFSVNGRDNTTILGSELLPGQATIEVSHGVSDVTIGDTDKGFHIVGFDKNNPASENATVYLLGGNNNITIRDNEIEARGELGLLTNHNQWYDNIVIDANEFSGQTFGPPAGSGGYFTGTNVPRALVFFNGSDANDRTTNVFFTNNKITGTTGGLDVDGNYSGNLLVNITSAGATISGNEFDGNQSTIALRVRGSDINVFDNDFYGDGRGVGIHADNVKGLTIGGATTAEANTVTGFKNGIEVNKGSGTILVQNNDVSGNTDTNAGRTASNWTTGIGILISNLLGATISDNTVSGNTDGIRILNSDAAALGDIVVSGNTATGNADKGIIIKDSDNIEVSRNTAQSNAIGIYADASRGTLIKANTVSGNTTDGVHLRASGNSRVENNFISTNKGAGVYVDGAQSGIRIFDNSITATTGKLVHSTTSVVDASGNWWGSTNQTYINGKMTGNVDFSPYQALGTDTDGDSANGYQGDFSYLHATALGAQAGSLSRIQEAVNLLANGINTGIDRTVDVNAGIYAGNFDLDKSMTLKGAKAGVDARGRATAGESVIRGYLRTAGNLDGLVIDGFTFENQGETVPAYGGRGSINLNTNKNVTIANNVFDGQYFDNLTYGTSGIVTSSAGAEDVTIKNNSFGDLRFGIYVNPNAKNVNIEDNDFIDNRYGIVSDDSGFDTNITGNLFSGNTVSGVHLLKTVGSLQDNRFDNNEQHIRYLGAGPDILLDAASGNLFWFDGQYKDTGALTHTQLFDLEDQVTHKMDNAGYGLLRFRAGEVYVTGNTLGIQHGIDVASAGDTVHVDGGTYAENLLIDKTVKLTGHGTTLEYDLSNTGPGRGNNTGNLVTVTADNVNIDPFTFDGLGHAAYGAYSSGTTGFVVDRNTYQNFTQAGIGLNNTTDALITGNILSNTGVYGVLINGGTGNTVQGGSITNTLWDSIRVLYAADTTIQNISLSHAGTSQGVNGVGSGIVFVGANGAKVDTVNISDIARIGIYAGASADIELVNNTITNVGTGTNTSHGDSIGKFSGIHVEGTNGLTVTNNTISGATKDGINLGGLINVPYAGAVTGTVLINDNVINTTGEDGIDVTGGTGVSITGNHVGFTEPTPGVYAAAGNGNIKGDGIRLSSSNGADVTYNFINGVSKNGINVLKGSTIDILGNNLNRIGEVGIRTDQVATLNITSVNDLDNIGWQGIQIEGGSAANVDGNIIRKAGGRGITVSGTNGSTVNNNTVYNIGESGVVVNGGKNSSITGNVIYTVGTKGAGNWDGIQSNGVGEALNITGNFIGHTNKSGAVGTSNNIRNDGIDVTNGGVVTISGNTIDQVGYNGIKAHTIGTLKITDNTVGVQSAVIQRGIDIASATNAQVIGNTLDNILTYGLFGNTVNGLKFYDNDVTGLSNAQGTGVYLTGTSGADIGNYTQVSVSGPWWSPVITLTPRDNRINDLNMGVQIVGGNNNNIVNNTIANVHNGVKLDGSTNADVLDNTITGNSVTGIDVVSGSHGATVDGNTLTTFATGINIVGSDNVTVTDNTLSDVLNGIVASGADILRIRDNSLTGRGNTGTGISVTASDDVIIGGYDLVSFLGFPVYQGNAVQSFQNGINADGVTLLKIQGNRVDGAASTGTGIKITNSNGAQIGGTGTLLSYLQSNYITGFWDGIQSNNSSDARIVRNTVEDSKGDGIRVDSVDAANDTGVHVLSNIVSDVGRTGIWLKNQNTALVDLNRVNGTTSFSGIRAEGGTNVTISNNRSNNTGTHGISANGVVDLNILDNFIGLHGGNIGADGINVVSSGGAEIMRNRIADTVGEGVYVDGSAGTQLVQNQINNTGSHAIHVNNSAGSFAQVNFIGQLGGPANIDGDGIRVTGNSQGATITGNQIANTGTPATGIGSGISVSGNVTGTKIGGAGIQANIIDDVAWDGIRVERTSGAGTGVEVLNNDITTAGRVGIWLKNLVGAKADDNVIEDTGLSGIRAEGGSNVTASNNVINDTGTHGISVDGAGGLTTLKGNKIGLLIANSITGDGIHVVNGSNATVGGPGAEANQIKDATNGMVFDNVTGLITVDNNTVEDSAAVGILFQGGTIGNVVLKGNKLTDNVIGAQFESGNIDLTGAANVFTNGGTGMVFDRFGGVAPLSLVPGASDIPGTNGTFGTTVFTGQTGPYIVFANNALSNGFDNPIKLDASYVTFGTFVPDSKARNAAGIPILTQAEFDAIENKVTHFFDSKLLGQILFGIVPSEINQEELFRVLDFGAFGSRNLNVRITGLPSIPGGQSAAFFNNLTPFAGGNTTTAAATNSVDPADLNNIATAAGGDGSVEQASAQQLNDIDTAAGDQDVGCWTDAVNAASAGQSANLSYGSGMDDVLSSAASCGTSL